MTAPKIKGVSVIAPPWEPSEVDPADIGAIKSLIDGTASAVQQRRIVLWIERASGIGELAFRPGGDDGRRASDFAEGKRFVGLQFFTLAKAVMPPSENSKAAP